MAPFRRNAYFSAAHINQEDPMYRKYNLCRTNQEILMLLAEMDFLFANHAYEDE